MTQKHQRAALPLWPPAAWDRQLAAQCGAAILYCSVAVSMGVINRFALLAFPLPTVLLLAQMLATLALLWPLLAAGTLAFPLFRWTRFTQLFGISALYTANTAFALFGLRSLNLPMYTALKRLTPMVILAIKSAWTRCWPAPRLAASVGLVVLGCIVAGAGDLAFDGPGYACALTSCCLQAAYLLLVEFQADAMGAASSSELLWYNALTSLPLLALITAATGDFGRVPSAWAQGLASQGPAWLVFLVAATATFGCLLNFSLFLCTSLTSALTTTICGVLRGVLTTALGFALDTVPFSWLNLAGICLNTAGGVSYAAIKYRDKQAAAPGGQRGGSSSTARGRQSPMQLNGSAAGSPLLRKASEAEEGAAGGSRGSGVLLPQRRH